MKSYTFKSLKSYTKCYYALKDKGFSESLISFLRKKDGRITINSKPATTLSPVKRLDVIKINLQDETGTNIPSSNLDFDILFENDAILVINKPANLSCIPSKSNFQNNLANAVCNYLGKNYVYRAIGRLDKETSGIVVIAKDRLTAENLCVEKTYYAICEGNFPFKEIEINLPISTISKDGINQRKRTVLSKEQKIELINNGYKIDEKPAKTIAKKIKSRKNKSLLKLTLETGRTHQIRVHLSTLGYPLIDDTLYGKGNGKRALLHCQRARIFLPLLNFKKTIIAPFPADFYSKTELPKLR